MTAGSMGHPHRGRPWAFHDPPASMGGVVPTRTTRLWLAVVGLALCAASTFLCFQLGMAWAGALLAALSVSALVNIGWVGYRRYRD
jgi:hypothetical protein